MVRVLVTGAAGFIGQHTSRALHDRGHILRRMDKRWGNPTSDPQTARLVEGCDVVVHLGAQCSTAASLRDPAGDFVDNALGTVNVAEASRLAGGVPILYVSTVKVAPGHDGLVAPLGRSKLVGEEYLRLYRDLYGLPSVILRPSTVYGPRQDGTSDAGWVTWFAKAALTGQQIKLAEDGSQTRDILFVDDFVALLLDITENFAAYREAVDSWPSEPFEVGGGPANEVPLLGLLNALNYRNVVLVPRPPGDLQRVVMNNARVSAVRGWVPTVGWREGLARTVRWLKGELI